MVFWHGTKCVLSICFRSQPHCNEGQLADGQIALEAMRKWKRIREWLFCSNKAACKIMMNNWIVCFHWFHVRIRCLSAQGISVFNYKSHPKLNTNKLIYDADADGVYSFACIAQTKEIIAGYVSGWAFAEESIRPTHTRYSYLQFDPS